MVDVKDCQTISDALVRIDAHATRVDNRIRKAIQEMNRNMMPYIAKIRADAWLNEARTLLKALTDEKKAIYELLKQEREGQE